MSGTNDVALVEEKKVEMGFLLILKASFLLVKITKEMID